MKIMNTAFCSIHLHLYIEILSTVGWSIAENGFFSVIVSVIIKNVNNFRTTEQRHFKIYVRRCIPLFIFIVKKRRA